MRCYTLAVSCLFTIALGGAAGQAACRWTYVDGRPQQSCDNPLDPPSASMSRLSPGTLPSPPHVDIPNMPPTRPGDCPVGSRAARCR
jgi:hypothetical protein